MKIEMGKSSESQREFFIFPSAGAVSSFNPREALIKTDIIRFPAERGREREGGFRTKIFRRQKSSVNCEMREKRTWEGKKEEEGFTFPTANLTE